MNIPSNNIIPESWRLDHPEDYKICHKYLPSTLDDQDLTDFLNHVPHPLLDTPHLKRRHPTIPHTRKLVTINKRVVDPLVPATILHSVCLEISTRSKNISTVLNYRILRPLFWNLAEKFPVEIATLLLSVPSILPEHRVLLNPKQNPNLLQCNLQHEDGMFDLFILCCNSLATDPSPLFARLYLTAEFTHHLSLINRYAGASEFPISVATHSVIALRIAKLKTSRSPQFNYTGIDLRRRLLAVLLHDTGEAYVNDQIGFLRDSTDIVAISESLIVAGMYSLFGVGGSLGFLTTADLDFVRQCDQEALNFELAELHGDPSLDLLGFKNRIDPSDLINDPLDHFRFQQTPQQARHSFLLELYELLKPC